jgi:hypothetical protein
MPVWLQRGLILSFVGGYTYLAILPLLMKKSPPGLQELLVKVFRAGAKKISGDK